MAGLGYGIEEKLTQEDLGTSASDMELVLKDTGPPMVETTSSGGSPVAAMLRPAERSDDDSMEAQKGGIHDGMSMTSPGNAGAHSILVGSKD